MKDTTSSQKEQQHPPTHTTFLNQDLISRGYVYGITDEKLLSDILKLMVDYIKEVETYFPGVTYRWMAYRIYPTESEIISIGLCTVKYFCLLKIKIEPEIILEHLLKAFNDILGKYKNEMGFRYTQEEIDRIYKHFKKILFAYRGIEIRESHREGYYIRFIIEKIK